MAFLVLDDVKEIFYGGAAGGGKSEALLMAALQYVDRPEYNAVILRRTFRDLNQPEAIMDRAKQWLLPQKIRWNEDDRRFTFPSGARLGFGYIDGPNDHLQYQSAEYHFIGFDEASELRWNQIMFLYSRLRRKKGCSIPLRFRLASNPGGVSHQIIKERYIDSSTRRKGVVFIPARIEDNPYLNQEEYIDNLNNLDRVTRSRLRFGDWEIEESGLMFERHWFEIVNAAPPSPVRTIRMYDLASTDKRIVRGRVENDPDWTVGARCSIDEQGVFWVEHMIRLQRSPAIVEKYMDQIAEEDGRGIPVYVEEEPGASGKWSIFHIQKDVLPGYEVRGVRSTGDKVTFARPMSAYAEKGLVRLVRGNWNTPFLDECEAFPLGSHDDMVDTVSKAFSILVGKKKRARRWGRTA